MADYTINKCSLKANKFKIYVNFLEFQIKLIKQNTAYMLLTKVYFTVCFKIKDTSPIVSLLFWLNSDLLNFWEKGDLIFIAINKLTGISKIEINCVILNAIYCQKINFAHHQLVNTVTTRKQRMLNNFWAKFFHCCLK